MVSNIDTAKRALVTLLKSLATIYLVVVGITRLGQATADRSALLEAFNKNAPTNCRHIHMFGMSTQIARPNIFASIFLRWFLLQRLLVISIDVRVRSKNVKFTSDISSMRRSENLADLRFIHFRKWGGT